MQIRTGQEVNVEFPNGMSIEGIALHDVADAYEARFSIRDGGDILVVKGWLAEDIYITPTL